MNHNKFANPRDRFDTIRCALLILPAIMLGVWAMIRNGVSPILWGQQIAAWLLFSLLSVPLRSAAKRISATACSILFLVALSATLLQPALGGVRRWLDLGILSVNAAMLVLPVLLSVLPRVKYPHPLLLAAAAVLALQPDLSQLTALCAAALPLLWLHRHKRLWTLGSLIALTALVLRCICTPTALEPVSYSENILVMLGSVSWRLQVIGCITLAAIPACFAFLFANRRQSHHLSLALYYAASMLFALTGEYPVPFMGFALSPIAGYFLAYICMPEGADIRPQ